MLYRHGYAVCKRKHADNVTVLTVKPAKSFPDVPIMWLQVSNLHTHYVIRYNSVLSSANKLLTIQTVGELTLFTQAIRLKTGTQNTGHKQATEIQHTDLEFFCACVGINWIQDVQNNRSQIWEVCRTPPHFTAFIILQQSCCWLCCLRAVVMT